MILVDLNVLLDVIQQREPHYRASAAVLEEVVRRREEGGLATEAETLERLMAKLRVMVPELLEENGVDVGMTGGKDVPLRLVSRREEILHLP